MDPPTLASPTSSSNGAFPAVRSSRRDTHSTVRVIEGGARPSNVPIGRRVDLWHHAGGTITAWNCGN
jgi:hypothetical protein